MFNNRNKCQWIMGRLHVGTRKYLLVCPMKINPIHPIGNRLTLYTL